MVKATEIQVDGNHYSKYKMQPMQLTYAINGTAGFCKLAKYITRDKGTVELDLEKALHVVSLEEELIANNALYYCESVIDGNITLVDESKIYKLIIEFAHQFAHSNAIFCVLAYMQMRQYAAVRKHLKILTKLKLGK